MLVEWPGGSWQASVGLIAMVTLTYVALIWLALVFWTVRDAARRSASLSTQLVAGALVLCFFVPGYWLYLILRPRLTLADKFERNLESEAVLAELSDRVSCGDCGRRVREDFVHCPSCKSTLRHPCDSCGRSMDFAWVMCPSCGTEPAPQRETSAFVGSGALEPVSTPPPVVALVPRPGFRLHGRPRANKSAANL